MVYLGQIKELPAEGQKERIKMRKYLETLKNQRSQATISVILGKYSPEEIEKMYLAGWRVREKGNRWENGQRTMILKWYKDGEEIQIGEYIQEQK